jgi:transcriptional regulator with XRE-family HTH domain
MSQVVEAAAPDPIDMFVGRRVRAMRKERRISQTELGRRIGVSFQQVQKYERGANRVSASKLYEIAKTLQVPVSFFFDGLADPMSGAEVDDATQHAEKVVQEFLTTPEGLELAEVFPRIGRGRVRRQVLDLVRAMADEASRETA